MALRAQVLQLMNQLDDAQKKARVEFELGEKARARVCELERLLAVRPQVRAKKTTSEARYELHGRSASDREWFRMGSEWTYKTKSSALAALELHSEGKEESGWRVLDRKTGAILTA